LGNLGIAYGTAGDWPTAREYVERGMEYAQSTGQSADVANPLRSLGQLCLWEGDWDSASRYLHEALSLAESAGDRSQSEGAQYDLAQLDLLQGDPKSALARLDPFVKDLDHAADYLLPNLAWAYAMLGDDNHIERGLEIAALAVERGRRQPGFLMDALLILGIVLMTGGRKDEARTALEEGLELARAWPYPYLQARILEQLALLDDQKEQSAQARLCLDEAAAIFSRLGAGRDQARVEARVAKLTPRP
jgi:tetratricopeptide (TPR) repeat protein